MKKLLTTLALAVTLSIPSVVFAEASWYGSLRAGVESKGGNISVVDGVSRWGIKGSAEAGEGLTAVYRFESKISTTDGGQPGGRLAYVGLSGGFGSVTVGQIWNAAYNSFGAITDNSGYYGDSQTGYRHGQAVSYAFSNDMLALQLDAIYDGGDKDDANNPDLEKVEFGLTVNVGDIGKIAFAHIDDKYELDNNDTADDESDDTSWRKTSNSIAGQVSVSGLRVYVGTQTKKNEGSLAGTNSVADTAADSEEKTTFFGFGGGLGDTGVNYLFQWRDVKDSHKPWVLRLSKSLGGGASMDIEHANNDGDSDNATRVNLKVDF